MERHSKAHNHPNSLGTKKALILAVAVTAAILVTETVGGFWTNSLALLSDAVHVFMDLLSFLLTLSALYLAERPASDDRTFGWHRLEVFAALANGTTVFGAGILIMVQAIKRISAPEPVMGPQMLAIACVGLAANLFVIWKLHPHVEGDLNVRGAFLHAFGDAAASVAVVVSGLVILKTGKTVVDPVAAMAVAVLLWVGAWRVLRDAIHILLEGAPRGIKRTDLVRAIEEAAGPGSVADLHVWNLCSHLSALSVHLVVAPERMSSQREILENVTSSLEKKFNIIHPTIQIESSAWRDPPR